MANETGLGHRITAGHLGLAECCVWESLLTVWLASQRPTGYTLLYRGGLCKESGYTLLYREWLFPVAVGGPTIFRDKIAIFPLIHYLATAIIDARACISGSSSIRMNDSETSVSMIFTFCLF